MCAKRRQAQPLQGFQGQSCTAFLLVWPPFSIPEDLRPDASAQSSRTPPGCIAGRQLHQPWDVSAVLSPVAPEQVAVADAHRVRGRHPHHRADPGDGAAPEPCRPLVRSTAAAAREPSRPADRLSAVPVRRRQHRDRRPRRARCRGAILHHPRQRPRLDQCGPAASRPELRPDQGRRLGGVLHHQHRRRLSGRGLRGGHRDRRPDPHPDLRNHRNADRRPARGSRAHEPRRRTEGE